MRGWRPPFWLVLGGAALVGLVATLACGSGINGTENSSVRLAGLGKSFSFPTASTAVAGPLAVSDNFDRANNASLGANWTTVTGLTAPSVSGTVCWPPTGQDGAYWSASTFADNQYSQAKVRAPGTYTDLQTANGPAVAVRQAAGANTRYEARLSVAGCGAACANLYLKLYKVVAGTYTQLSTTTIVSAGDGVPFMMWVRLEASGTSIKYRYKFAVGDAWIDHTVTNAVLTSGYPGVIPIASNDYWYADDWFGGDL